jgi:hypothetical protein
MGGWIRVVGERTFARGVADLRIVPGFGGRHLQLARIKDTECGELRFGRVLVNCCALHCRNVAERWAMSGNRNDLTSPPSEGALFNYNASLSTLFLPFIEFLAQRIILRQ